MARINATNIPADVLKKAILFGLELHLGVALAAEITNGQSGQIEVDDEFGSRTFVFDVKVRETSETASTGVEFMGERETYIRHTYTAQIEHVGTYDREGDEIAEALEYGVIAEAIAEQSNEYETIYATVK